MKLALALVVLAGCVQPCPPLVVQKPQLFAFDCAQTSAGPCLPTPRDGGR